MEALADVARRGGGDAAASLGRRGDDAGEAVQAALHGGTGKAPHKAKGLVEAPQQARRVTGQAGEVGDIARATTKTTDAAEAARRAEDLVDDEWVDALIRHDDAGDLVGALGDRAPQQRIVVELGSGDFANLPHIIADNSGARVIGIEHPDVYDIIELARQHPGVVAEWDAILKGYEKALEKGAEVHFLDFGQGIPFKANQIISIAPNPTSSHDMVRAATSSVVPGSQVYIAAVPGESTADWIARGLAQEYGIKVEPVIGTSRYPSSWLPGRTAQIIDLIVPR